LKSLGVSRIGKLPNYTVNIIRKISSGNRNLKIIIFPSKADSIEYEKVILQKQGLAQPDRVISEASRYTLLSSKQKNLLYLLLNKKSIEENAINFLIELFKKILAKIEEYGDVLEEQDERLTRAFAESLFSYNRKMGIPFIYADEMVRTYVTFSVQNIQQSYLEGLVLREMISEGVHIDRLADYLEYKIGIIFESFDFEMRFQLFEVFEVLQKMILVASLMSSVSISEPLSQNLTNIFKKHLENFKLRYSELHDFLRAVDSIFAEHMKITFSSYNEYTEIVSTLILTAFSEIEARYVTLAECVTLLGLSQFYLDGLENGELVRAPHIGSIYNYIELLEGIFSREDIYPEVRIIAGMALEDILFSWTFMDHNFLRYLKIIDCVKQLCKLIEKSLPEIRKKNGPLNGFTGSPLTYEDFVLKLLVTSKTARSFGDFMTEKELIDIAEKMATKYDLPSIKLILWWAKFVEFQAFSYLPKIHEAAGRIDLKKFPYLNYFALPIDLLAQALLYREDVESRIRHAQELVLDGLFEGGARTTYVSQNIQTSQALFCVLEIFKQLLMSAQCHDYLRKAYLYSLTLKQILPKIDPLNIFALKTEILYKLKKHDFSDASQICKELIRYSDPKGNIRFYTEFILKWIEICKKEPERRYLHQRDFLYDGNDIWTQIFLSFVRESMEDDLSKSILGSKAIIFVEGETDAFVLKEFTRKLFPNIRVFFIEIEGYTNYQYYLEAKMTKELKIPCYLLLDGDTTEEKKADLVKRFRKISLKKESIYRLQKHSIENYLLIPRALKCVYSSKNLSENNIAGFLFKNRHKKNKKLVLKTLFKKAGLKYDKNCAKSIAFEINSHEIDTELTHLLERICKLRKLNS